NVTGVQTCALPISTSTWPSATSRRPSSWSGSRWPSSPCPPCSASGARTTRSPPGSTATAHPDPARGHPGRSALERGLDVLPALVEVPHEGRPVVQAGGRVVHTVLDALPVERPLE